MDPLSLIASIVPSIVGLFGGDESDKQKSEDIVTTDMELFGITDKEELTKRLMTRDTSDVDKLRIRLENKYNLYKVEVDDRISARDREVALGNNSAGNRLMYVLAITVVLVNLILLWFAFERPDTLNNPGIMALAGAHTSALTLVLSYFFGSSIHTKK
jgi:hypothetical protein